MNPIRISLLVLFAISGFPGHPAKALTPADLEGHLKFEKAYAKATPEEKAALKKSSTQHRPNWTKNRGLRRIL